MMRGTHRNHSLSVIGNRCDVWAWLWPEGSLLRGANLGEQETRQAERW